MNFSRTHAGMVALVSIFTGMIAPVVADSTRSYPFPLTDMQWGAYIVLALLVLCFYFVSTHNWKIFGLFGWLLLVLLGYLFSVSIRGGVYDTFGNPIPSLSWGWLFLAIGTVFLVYTMFAEDTRETKTTLFIDHIIGIVGSGTIFCLMVLIILMSHTPRPTRNHDHILVNFFWSGQVVEASWVTISPSFGRIEHLTFDRKNDDIHFVAWSGSQSYVFPGGHIGTGNIVSIVRIGQETITIRNDATLEINSIVQPTRAIFPQSLESAVISRTATGVSLLTEHGTIFFPGKHEGINTIVRAEKLPIVAWIEASWTGDVVMKNNEVIGNQEASIESLSISPDGSYTIALVKNVSWEREIIKNWVRIDRVFPWYVTGSFQSNGSSSIYKNKYQNAETIAHNGIEFNNQFDEIREIFLEKNGNSYAFFARPRGESRYCLFTRFRGNLCGLDGYMNPRLSADGQSILFAGYKNGLWSIYRNTNTVIRDTGYHGINITNDYAFFDTTNPKLYLFIEKTWDGKYLYRKNGKVIPWLWEDVSLDVWFWYDNKIITAARDTLGWRIVEM